MLLRKSIRSSSRCTRIRPRARAWSSWSRSTASCRTVTTTATRALRPATFPSQDMYRTAFELTYGFTDHVEGAAYLNLAHPNADSFQYAGSKFRVRGSLFEQGELPVDLGWYLELEWHKTPQFDDNAARTGAEADYREGFPEVRNRSQSNFREKRLRRPQQEQGLRVRLRRGHLLRLPARRSHRASSSTARSA